MSSYSNHTPRPGVQSALSRPIPSFLALQRGMAMLEYIILAALLAIGTIAVVQNFGEAIQSQFASMTKEIAGVDSAAERANAAAAAVTAANEARRDKGLGNYGVGNKHP